MLAKFEDAARPAAKKSVMALKGKQGNILISAIFIAVFLFFLSVALISANRQDINLTMLADHKLRARHAAEEAAAYALQIMKEDPLWEGKFLNKSYTPGNTGDVTWSVIVKIAPTATNASAAPANTTADANGTLPVNPNPTNWDPSLDKIPHLYEIVGKGVSGVYASEYRLMVEEFRLADSIASRNLKPFLFMVEQTDGGCNLCMLDPSFNWHRLAPLDTTEFLVPTLTGNGGDVYISTKGKTKPLLIQDWSYTTNYGFYAPTGFKPAPLDLQIPMGNDVQKLTLTGLEAKWTPMDDPSKHLAKITQATIDGSENGKPNIVMVPIPGVGLIPVDVAEYRGPSLQYFIIDGDLHANKDNVYCHATHYFYKGIHFQNRPAMGTNSGFLEKPARYSGDCILSCKTTGGNWSVACDTLKVTDPYAAPTIVSNPKLNKTYLCSDDEGKLYSLGSNNPSTAPVVVECNAQDVRAASGDLSNPLFFLYDKKIRTTAQIGEGSNNTLAYTDLPLTALYPTVTSEELAKSYNGPDTAYGNVIVAKEKRLTWKVGKDLNGVAQSDKDIITTGTVSIAEVDLKAKAPPTPTSYNFLCHYDGSRWQLWPSGFAPLLAGKMPAGSPTNPTIIVSQGKFTAALNTTPIALGGYSSSSKLLRHYQAIITAYP